MAGKHIGRRCARALARLLPPPAQQVIGHAQLARDLRQRHPSRPALLGPPQCLQLELGREAPPLPRRCVRRLRLRHRPPPPPKLSRGYVGVRQTDSSPAIRQKSAEGKEGEPLFFELAIEDLRRAANLFRPVHERTNGVDGWVSLEVSPLLANDTAGTIAAAADLHRRAKRPNLFIKIPGTAEGLPAIEASIAPPVCR